MLYQLWAFVAPALYREEKRLARPLLYTSVVLFYAGCAFAYFVVFPLVFGFFTRVAPEGVTVMTDISKYLDFVMTLFLAFGITFEVPIATIILVATGMTTIDQLAKARGYVAGRRLCAGHAADAARRDLADPAGIADVVAVRGRDPDGANPAAPSQNQRRRNRRIRRAADCRLSAGGAASAANPNMSRKAQYCVPNNSSWNSISRTMISPMTRPRSRPPEPATLNSRPMMTATGSNSSSRPRPSSKNGSQLTISARKPVTSAAPSLKLTKPDQAEWRSS